MKALSSILPALVSALHLASSAGAQEAPDTHAATPQVAAAAVPTSTKVDIITPHITDGYHMEVPSLRYPFYREFCVGRHVGEHGCEPLWGDIHIGNFTINLSPTKHVVMMLVVAILLTTVMLVVARSHQKHSHASGHPKGFAGAIEALVLYLRNEVILPNVGHHGNGFVPFLLTAFFFILIANLLGMVPFGSTATGNISVTATLALMTFIVVEVAGMRALGSHYLSTIFYWNRELPLAMRIIMFFVMSPVELIGKFTKPFALAIRLFANMTAGHIVLLAFIGLIFTFASVASAAPFLMAIVISVLELFVAFLQAFIFTLLSAVFIGQIREAAH
ncbi:MAG: F0F1 ATP synthase subunit A [Gemmatimonadota bacterium]